MSLWNKALEYAPRLLAAVATGGGSEIGKVALSVATEALGLSPQATQVDVVSAIQTASPEQLVALKNAEVRFKELELETLRETNRADEVGSAALTNRIATLEGTASDLAQMPIFGRIMLFFRGCQRPIWGFFTLLLDYQLFSGGWKISPQNEQFTAIVWLVNLLVLAFLFGERALKNLEPLILKIVDRSLSPKKG